MTPKEFNEFLQETKATIDGINSAWIVVDDSQLGNTLERKSTDSNAFLVGVLPSYGTKAKNSDAVGETMVSQLLVVEKTDYSELSDDDFIQVFERTFLLAKKVKEHLIFAFASGCYSSSGILDLEAIEIVPVWKKTQCNGWSIYFNLE